MLIRLVEFAFRSVFRVSSWVSRLLARGGSAAPKKILVVETTRIGDVLLTTPALRLLKSCYPDADITYVAEGAAADVLRHNPNVGRVAVLQKSDSLRGLWAGIRQVRAEAYDVALNCSPAARNAILTWLARAPVKIGYFERFRSQEGSRRPIPVSGIGLRVLPSFAYRGQHLADRALDVVKALWLTSAPGLEATATARRQMEDGQELPNLELHIPEEVRLRVAQEYFHDTADRPAVVIHTTASWSYRTWAPARFKDLLKRLYEINPALQIFLVGANSERAFLDQLVADAGCPANVVAGGDLHELAALIQLAGVFIGAASGPLHIASAAGTPCVALLGPDTPAAARPIGSRHRVFYKRVDCSPCAQLVCVCPENPCTHLISVDEVAGAAMEVLAQRTRG
jgi:ADP-heptose:LPS heptosyltransferase